MIDLDGIYLRYGKRGQWVLHDLHWHLLPGKWVAIIGDNGAGKSTLAQVIKGILVPQRGRVRILGAKVSGPLPPQQVAWVAADPTDQVLGATVEEDVAFCLECLGEPPGCIRQKVSHALERFGLRGLGKHPPHLLSGGEQQRVALAAAWTAQPRIWVLDEALSMANTRGLH